MPESKPVNVSSALSDTEILPRCEKYLRPLIKKKKKPVVFEAIGSPPNNQLVDLLKCQCKGSDELKEYLRCHGGVMGMGSYGKDNKKHCAEELQVLFQSIL